LPTWKAHRECFDEATSCFDPPFEKVEIPYEGTTLPGYVFKVDDSDRPRPLLILNNGSDGPISAMYLQGGAAAIERGYNALAFDGPGQDAALHLQGLHFRPDWEKVVTPVVDFVLGRPDVDPGRKPGRVLGTPRRRLRAPDRRGDRGPRGFRRVDRLDGEAPQEDAKAPRRG
jgi:hypothetical protein